jgi:hypothetical protein
MQEAVHILFLLKTRVTLVCKSLIPDDLTHIR